MKLLDSIREKQAIETKNKHHILKHPGQRFAFSNSETRTCVSLQEG